jgi:hypothetical protein
MATLFHVGDERIELDTNAAEVARLAARLWHPGPPPTPPSHPPIRLRIAVTGGAWPGTHPSLPLRWQPLANGFEFEAGTGLTGTLRFDRREAVIALSHGLLSQAVPFVVRAVLEAPVASLLARGSFVAIHAAGICGPRGALVIRGRSGAGKSTLTAAAVRAGLRVLGDESVLVARDDADLIVASVREVAVRADSAVLLGLPESKNLTTHESGRKIAVALPTLENPEDRAARRVATWLLGRRDAGPARLLPLTPHAFSVAFREGATPEEQVGGDAVDRIMGRWAEGPVWQLDGAADLAGAIECLRATVA